MKELKIKEKAISATLDEKTNLPKYEIQNLDKLVESMPSKNIDSTLNNLRDIMSYCTKTGGKDIEATTQKINAILSTLDSLKPTDNIEHMLISQMLLTNDLIMRYATENASPSNFFESDNINQKKFFQTSKLFIQQLDALGKFRRGGEQKVTVQHVNVSNGGQAVVTQIRKDLLK